MSLQTAQLGGMPNIQLPYGQVVQKKPSVVEQALAAFAANLAGTMGGRIADNAFARDYAPEGQKAGFWAKLGSGPVVSADQNARNIAAKDVATRDTRLAELEKAAREQGNKYTTDLERLRNEMASVREDKDRAFRAGESSAGRKQDLEMFRSSQAQQKSQSDQRFGLDAWKAIMNLPKDQAELALLRTQDEAARAGIDYTRAGTAGKSMDTSLTQKIIEDQYGKKGQPAQSSERPPMRSTSPEAIRESIKQSVINQQKAPPSATAPLPVGQGQLAMDAAIAERLLYGAPKPPSDFQPMGAPTTVTPSYADWFREVSRNGQLDQVKAEAAQVGGIDVARAMERRAVDAAAPKARPLIKDNNTPVDTNIQRAKEIMDNPMLTPEKRMEARAWYERLIQLKSNQAPATSVNNPLWQLVPSQVPNA